MGGTQERGACGGVHLEVEEVKEDEEVVEVKEDEEDSSLNAISVAVDNRHVEYDLCILQILFEQCKKVRVKASIDNPIHQGR